MKKCNNTYLPREQVCMPPGQWPDGCRSSAPCQLWPSAQSSGTAWGCWL